MRLFRRKARQSEPTMLLDLFRSPRPADLALNRPLVVLDTETTGTDAQRDRIVHLGLVRLSPDRGPEEFESFVDPEMSIPPAATSVHGIGDAAVASAPAFAEIAGRVRDFIGDADLCGFNAAAFDVPLLARQLREAGCPLDMSGRRVVDVKVLYHQLRPRTLSDAYRDFVGRELTGAHGAMADARAALEVVRAMLARHPDLPRRPGDLAVLLGDPDRSAWADPDGKFVRQDGRLVFAFGKYKGESLDDIARREPGFLRWMLDRDFSKEVKAIVREALRIALPTPPAK
jgi:DNA polymerase-3 subunit epsilon